MPTVQSLGSLTGIETAWAPSYSYGSLRMYNAFNYDYATLYKTQPNIRTCVDFLARNIAQLGLHVFQRKGETDRVRLRDHPLAKLIEQPLPPEMKVTRYHLIESLMADLGIYFNAYWLKVRAADRFSLLRAPPPWVTPSGGIVPMSYEVALAGRTLKIEPAGIVHFRGYNPLDPISGLSPLETLRRVLAEEHAAGDYREHFWANSARMNGIIERPADAPTWSKDARERFKAEFEALYSGSENSGKTAILEEGMAWKESSFNAQESEYLAGRKLTREECARAYHIPLPMVGILDNATFSNIREQHKNLYQDSLGPWLSMIEGDIELQLLPDLDKTPGVYVEFNIQEKLQGSFEEQVASLQSSVGAPWLTRDEARARMNLPSMGGDATRLVVPLNVLVGGQASPRDSAPPPKALPAGMKARREGQIDPSQPGLRERHEIKWTQVLEHHFKRQQDAIVGRVPEKARKQSIGDLWDEERWDSELHDDIYRLNVATATVWAKHIADQLDIELDDERMLPWLEENSRIAAEEINATTRDGLIQALKDDAPRSAALALFALAIDVRAPEIAASKVTTASTFGSFQGAEQAGLRTKTWQTNSANPREAHAALDGETVALDERFSNGQLWPGDPAGGAENNANCFPADAIVSADQVQQAYRRWYEGDLFQITTSRGHKLAATPNHPILTVLGWRPLRLLSEGDYVISRLGHENIPTVDPNIDHVNTPISEVFDLLALRGPTQRTRGVIEQFHGDGQRGYVDVVAVNGQLERTVKAAFLQPLGQEQFAPADISQGALLPESALGHLGITAPHAAYGSMGSFRQQATLGGTESAHTDAHGLTLGSQGDPCPQKSAPNRTARTSDAFGDRLFGLSGQIAADQIVNIERVPFSGHVYNLQTESGIYIANSIIAHNCKCSIVFGRE